MKTPEQLKGAIRNIAREKDLRAQEVLQIFFFERILARLSISPYNANFILKGGLLISSMIGISERTTMDMDTTVRGIPMEEDTIEHIVKEILSIDTDDGISFSFTKMESIREDDVYNNFRVHITASYGKIQNKMKIDITTGDQVTPAAVKYNFHSLFDEKDIPVMAYTLETILAEKYETILRRNIGNTRARDFYDLYVLFHLYHDHINPAYFQLAVEHTSAKRGSSEMMPKYEKLCKMISAEPDLLAQWKAYTEDFSYAATLSFQDVVQNVVEVGKYLSSNAKNH